jgi:putative transposase
MNIAQLLPTSLANLRKSSQAYAKQNQIYLLTVTTIYRRKLFLDHDQARAIARCHIDKKVWKDSQCLAWVLMPDHWQGLVSIGRNDSLDRLVGRFKAMTAKAVDQRCLVNRYLWGRGYRECLLKNPENLEQLARHIVMSPVRAGLVNRSADYPYWNAQWLESGVRDR